VLLALFLLAAQQFTFDCRGLLHPKVSARELSRVLGAAHVKTETLHVAEGEMERGTVIFPDDPARRLEIFWKDRASLSSPRFVRVRGKQSRWRTPEGIGIGTDLRTIEKLNGRSFTLYGFEWDYGGTTADWRGGTLANSGACRFAARFAPPQGSKLTAEVGATASTAPIYRPCAPSIREFTPSC
jgi:hypothetical protein